MRRIAVLGTSGSGKTTLARTLAERLDLEHIELDALFHQPGWTQLPDGEFRASVVAAMAAADASKGGWTMCGGYDSEVKQLRDEAADTIVWLDLPRHVVMRRVITRTLRRAITRQELWNGNREPLTNFYRWDPEQNIIRWSWVTFDERRKQYERFISDGTWSHLTVRRMRSPADVDRFLNGLGERS